MMQKRLNCVCVPHARKDKLNETVDLTNDFLSQPDIRRNIFGNF